MTSNPSVPHALPPCPVYQACGGCDSMALEVGAQRRSKLDRVLELWTRYQLPEVTSAWEPTEQRTLGYRNRIRCQVTPGGMVRFFNPYKSSECVVLEPSVLEGIQVAQHFARHHPGVMLHFSALEVRGRDIRGLGAVVFKKRAGSEPPPDWASEAPAGWLFAVRGDSAAPVQRFRFTANSTVDVPVDAFLQVNHQANELLVRHVVGELLARKARNFADLYMGAGNFALPLLAAGLSGYGVETHAGAVKAAVQAAVRQGFPFTEAHAEDAMTLASRWAALGLKLDAVVCNPPRAGLRLHAEVVAGITHDTLVLCSCNPESLCRDVGLLLECGFGVDALRLFDMFPHTRHVESVVWLTRLRDRRSVPVAR